MKTLLSIVLAFACTSAFAWDLDLLPLGKHFETKMHRGKTYYDKMYGYVDVSVDKNYVAKWTFMASNGRQVDGGTFYATIKYWSGDKVVFTQSQSHKIGPAGWHGAVERKNSMSHKFTKEDILRITDITVDWDLSIQKNSITLGRDRGDREGSRGYR